MLFHDQNPTTRNTMLNIENASQREPYQVCRDDDKLFQITQRLNSTQYHYEFPPKSHFMFEEDNDESDEILSYDGYSLTSASTETYINSLHNNKMVCHGRPHEQQRDTIPPLDNTEQLLDHYLDILTFGNGAVSQHAQYKDAQHRMALDEELSPLQLPSQAVHKSGITSHRFPSIDTVSTTNRKLSYYAYPSSFLTDKDNMIPVDLTSYIFPDYISPAAAQHFDVCQAVHPYHRFSEEVNFTEDNLLSLHCDEDEDDSDMEDANDEAANVVLVKISKRKTQKQIGTNNITVYHVLDEHIENNYCDKPLDADTTFLPLDSDGNHATDHHPESRESAAVKIQALWRGYQCRNELRTSAKLEASTQVLAGLAHLNNDMQGPNINQLLERIDRLERYLEEETAMRIAFENAMDNMAAHVDNHNQAVDERMHQMQQDFTRRTERLMSHLESMYSVIRANDEARLSLEKRLSDALFELSELKLQTKREAEEKQSIQLQLDEALKGLASSKTVSRYTSQKQQVSTVAARTPVISSPRTQIHSASITAKTVKSKHQQPLSDTTTYKSRKLTSISSSSNAAQSTRRITSKNNNSPEVKKSATVYTTPSRTNKPTAATPRLGRAIAAA